MKKEEAGEGPFNKTKNYIENDVHTLMQNDKSLVSLTLPWTTQKIFELTADNTCNVNSKLKKKLTKINQMCASFMQMTQNVSKVSNQTDIKVFEAQNKA